MNNKSLIAWAYVLLALTGVVGLYPKLQKSDGGKQHQWTSKGWTTAGWSYSSRIVGMLLVSAFRESPISQSIYDLAGIASNRDRVLPSIASPFFACSEHGSTID